MKQDNNEKSEMNILYLPVNLASMPALTAQNLNKREGVNAKCLTISLSKFQGLTSDVIYLPSAVSKRNPFAWLYHRITFRKKIKKLIRWADVLHYTWLPVFENAFDLKYAFSLKKKIFIEWVGSEIRDPDYLKTINPYYKAAFESGYEYPFESKERSVKNQTTFARYNALPVVCAEVSLYVDRNIFPGPPAPLLYQRIDTENFEPAYPPVEKVRPLIVHSPSAPFAKGTNIILPMIEKLKKNYDFEFILLQDLQRHEVLEVIKKADIFLDQIILGSYGMAAMEAMSFGKPVMCYIMPQVFDAGLSVECPLVNTNPDNLEENLIKLICDPALRNSIGEKSRRFAEKYHSIKIVGDQLLQIYKTTA